MGLSNLPPGVTGREFAIAGWDVEETQTKVCPTCGVPREGLTTGYDHLFSWECGTCGDDTTEWDDYPDPDDYADQLRDAALDREWEDQQARDDEVDREDDFWRDR